MEAIKTQSVVGEDGRLRIDLQVPLPPGPVEVVMVISPGVESTPVGVNPETARQRFLAAAGCGESGDGLSSQRIDELLYGKKP